MAPFDPNPPSARDKRIARQPKGKPTARSKTSSRIEDRRGQPLPDPMDRVFNRDIDYDALTRYLNQPLSPAGRQMMTPQPNLGRSDQLNRNYSTSMAANMNAYFNRLMAEPRRETMRYEDGSVGEGAVSPSRYAEVKYGDIDKTQQQFREAQRQAMLRKHARNILEGSRGNFGYPAWGGSQATQPSMSQMMFRGLGPVPGNGKSTINRPWLGSPDLADVFVDPVRGQGAGNISTIADALAERRKLRPTSKPRQR